MNVNPTPKARLMASKELVEKHRELMQRGDLQRAIDLSLLEYQLMLARTPDQLAGAAHFKLVGAIEFVDVMMKLGESVHIPEAIKSPNLNHRA